MGSYLKANGLGSNQFHEKCVATRPDGTMLFGGNAGIEEVVPTAADISKLPRIDLITKKLLLLPGYTPALKDDMADVDEASVSELTLNHKENSLNIEFFGLNYDKSSNIEYAYMLEGLDKDFIYSGTYNNASYSNLASGNYNFYVRARYKGKQWQEPEKLLSLTVKPNPWFSTTANIIYALPILTAIIAGNRIYLRIGLIKQKICSFGRTYQARKEPHRQPNPFLYQHIARTSHASNTDLRACKASARQLQIDVGSADKRVFRLYRQQYRASAHAYQPAA